MTNTADDHYQTIIKASEAMSTLSNITEKTAVSYGNGSANIMDMLEEMRLVELAVDQTRRAIVARARAEGYTWKEIGDRLRTSRQAAHERFGN